LRTSGDISLPEGMDYWLIVDFFIVFSYFH
jgi:hypothetical protein